MKKTTLFLFLIAVILTQFSGNAVAQKWPGLRDSIFSKTLNEQRIFQILFPADYKDNPTKKYEVLYMVDGEWYMEQIPFIYNFTAGAHYAPNNIIVLIPNTYVKGMNLRDRDFSPTHMNDDSVSGGADNFHAFLKTELIPHVEGKVRASGQRTLVGSSYGGLFCIYAFVKDAPLFQSYVASDPSLSYDNNYVSKLAAKKMKEYANVNCTVYISALPRSYSDNGIEAMDSVMKAAAPAGIHFHCEQYPNESHYSVQHKAFYDGFRFSHLGYSDTPVEYHPMNGMVKTGSPLNIFVLSEHPALHVTADGSEPTLSSLTMVRGTEIVVTKPTHLKFRAFANRPEYEKVDAETGNFKEGTIAPDGAKSKKTKAGLTYKYYDGAWNKFPDLKSLKPAGSGVVSDDFNFSKVKGKQDLAFVVDGVIEAPNDGYYIFYTDTENGAKVTVGGQTLIDYAGGPGKGAQTYAVPLKKGLYTVHVELLQKKDQHTNFFVRHTKPGNDQWWTVPMITL